MFVRFTFHVYVVGSKSTVATGKYTITIDNTSVAIDDTAVTVHKHDVSIV